eukprot:52301_1
MDQSVPTANIAKYLDKSHKISIGTTSVTETKYDECESPRARVQTINTQLRKTTLMSSATLIIPYNKKNCLSILFYYIKSSIVRNPRLYSFWLLYCSIWPRLLVILDMYTDMIVAKDLYESNIENINTAESAILYMLACVFIIFPFMMVWTASLRFVQKSIKDTAHQTFAVNTFLILYLFPPVGCLMMTCLEIYWVIHDITRGIYFFIGGKILILNKDPQITAIKQFRKVIEFFGESLPQLLLQSYIFINGSDYVNTTSLVLSLFISAFSFAYNLSRLYRESKLHGMSVAEYALSLLQLSEIPIIKLVPRLPAIQKGLTTSANFASFNVDKESLGPIIDALSDSACKLKTLKLSMDSLSDLNSKSIKMFGSFLCNKDIKIVISQISDPQLLLTLFTRLDAHKRGYLSFDDFRQLLSATFYDPHIQTKIFQNLAIRRLKARDRVYFHDFYESLCGYRSKLTQYDFSIIQYPLHFTFKYISRLYYKVCNGIHSEDILIDFDIGRYALAPGGCTQWNPIFDKLQNLFWFAIGLGYDVQYDETNYYVHNHIFFTIADALKVIDNIRYEAGNIDKEKRRIAKLIQCFIWRLTWYLLKETDAVQTINELNRDNAHVLFYCIEHGQWALLADLLHYGLTNKLYQITDLDNMNLFTDLDQTYLQKIFYYACAENLDETVRYLIAKYRLQQLIGKTDITKYVGECRTPSLVLVQILLTKYKSQNKNLILLAMDWRRKQSNCLQRKMSSFCVMNALSQDENTLNSMIENEIEKYRVCVLDIIEYLTKQNNLLCIEAIAYAVENKDGEALMVMLKSIEHQNMKKIVNHQYTKYLRFGSKTVLDLSINNELYDATAYLIRKYMQIIDFDVYNEEPVVEHPVFLILQKYQKFLTDESLRECVLSYLDGTGINERQFNEKMSQLYSIADYLASYEPVCAYFGPKTTQQTLKSVYTTLVNLASFTQKSLDKRWAIDIDKYETLLAALETRLPHKPSSKDKAFLKKATSANPFYLVGFV